LSTGELRTGPVEHGVLVIRKELVGSFQPRLYSTPLTFETAIENRDRLPQAIVSAITGKLPEKAGHT